MARAVKFSALALLAAGAHAQVGWRQMNFRNPTNVGSSTLEARVHYPSTVAGQNAPLRSAPANGYPAVVFLHGYGLVGPAYDDFGARLAAEGFVAVVNLSSPRSGAGQRDDAFAYIPALQAESARSGSMWFGAFDTTRVGLGGHSMGGGNTIQVMASNPGYAAAFCLASSSPGGAYTQTLAPAIAAPLMMIHGVGDLGINWQVNSQSVFQAATSYTPAKAFVLLDSVCNHVNLARIRPNANAADIEVFELSARVTIGWLKEHLRGDAQGLERAIGPTLQADPRLTQVEVEMRAPRLWSSGAAVLGGTVGFRLAGEPGPAALLVAPGTGLYPTSIGPLLLDPNTVDWMSGAPIAANSQQVTSVAIPNDPNLLGASVYLQGAAQTDGFGTRLSNRIRVVVQ